LDEIRNRILNFVLEIEAQDPAAGEAALNSSPVPPEKVNQIFNTYISGNVQNVATGSHSFEQNTTSKDSNAEFFTQLLEALKSINQPEITTPISSNVEKMRSTQGTDSFKEHYQHFMSLLADHMQVLGPVVAPFLPGLAAIVP
jgi:Zn-dependent oligopeptidase